MKTISIKQASLVLRIVLGLTMQSAVAGRFGIWGAPGSAGVAWGNWENFINYTHKLNAFSFTVKILQPTGKIGVFTF